MENPTDAEIEALLQEVDAVIAASNALDERTERLLRGGSVAVRMADLALQMDQGRQELDEIERQQAAIEDEIEAMEAE
jgi:hypothetical protein